jgi:predicted oxidoreductase
MTSSLVDSTPRVIGEAGLRVGPLAYGLWRLTGDDVPLAKQLIESALEAGMNLIDTADVYGLGADGTGFGRAEATLGRVLAAAPELREQIVLATKGGIRPPTPYDSSDGYLQTAVDASLQRMGVDVIDLYQIHRPDLLAHPAAVAKTLTSLRTAGKIREVGISNHTPDQYEALAAHLPFPIATTQPEYSAAELGPLRDGTFDRAMRDGVVPLVWSPLAGGRLATGEGVPPPLIAAIDRIAAREGIDRTAVALAFILAHPARPVPIIGTQRPERIAGANDALGVHLDRDDVYALIEASEGVPLP